MDYTNSLSDLECSLLDAPTPTATTTNQTKKECNNNNKDYVSRLFIANCYLLHLVLLFTQFYAALQTHRYDDDDDEHGEWKVYGALVIFGISGFLYRDSCYEAKINADSMVHMLPEICSNLVILCILCGYAEWGFRVLLGSVIVMGVATAGLSVRYLASAEETEARPDAETPEDSALISVQVV